MKRLNREPDPYYQLARMMQTLNRQDLALALKQFHQSAVDDTMDAVCAIVDEKIADPVLKDTVTSDIRRAYVQGGHIADDRRYLARTEALLAVLLLSSHDGNTLLDIGQIDAAFAAGHGIDTFKTSEGKLEVTVQPEKFAGL
jgi:hypothetical protein